VKDAASLQRMTLDQDQRISEVLGMLALCRILFGGFAGHGLSRSRHMTPEERERFRQRMRERFGFGPSTSENKGQ